MVMATVASFTITSESCVDVTCRSFRCFSELESRYLHRRKFTWQAWFYCVRPLSFVYGETWMPSTLWHFSSIFSVCRWTTAITEAGSQLARGLHVFGMIRDNGFWHAGFHGCAWTVSLGRLTQLQGGEAGAQGRSLDLWHIGEVV